MITQLCKCVRSHYQLHKSPPCYSISAFFFSSSHPTTSKPKLAISVSEYLINQHQFSQDAASKVSLTVANLKNGKQADFTLSLLKQSGFSKHQIEEVIVRAPRLLSVKIDTVKPKINVFHDLGFLPSEIADIISSDPWILFGISSRFGPTLLLLKSILGSNEGLYRILKTCGGWFMKSDLEKTVLPNIEYMKNCGICLSQIIKYLYHFPRLFLKNTETIMDYVRRIDEMGIDRKSKAFLPAIRVLHSMSVENWELKLKLFRSLGFPENDILAVFRRVPMVFAVSERKIKKSTEFLFSSTNLDISYAVNHPELLITSVEHRLKPRLEILHTLEGKNILKKKPSLTTICRMTNKMFTERYGVPYSNELGENGTASAQQ